MLLYAVQTLCALFLPYVMSNIVEYGIRQQDMPYIWKEGAIMIALSVGALAVALITNSISSKFSSKLSVNIRKQVFNKVNSLSFEQFSEIGTGSLITRTTDDVGWIEETVVQLPYVLISAPMFFVGGVVLSFKGDWLLPLILLAVSLAVLVVTMLVSWNLEKYWQRGEEFTDVQNRIVRERLSGIRVVRAFDREEYEHQRTKRATSEMCNSFIMGNTISGIIGPIASLLLNVATVAVIYVGATRLQSNVALKAGDIIATIQYIALIANAVLILSWSISFIPHVKVSLKRVGEILDIKNNGNEDSLGFKSDGSIALNNVSFSYAEAHANALTDITLNVNSGEVVGIIGGTGSGKTTLVKLLMYFYSPNFGTIALGGRNYDELNPATVRDNISVALQKSTIFQGTVADNVRMGRSDATDEQVTEALRVAQMETFVKSKEQGINFVLAQSGSNLSGGQKQRINIARTILKDASVYVFDDSFSALDYLTETNLRRSLNGYLKGKTQIIITQRVATAMRCDKVIVLDAGRVVGVGTHQRLLDECDTYREIYFSQMGGNVNE